MLPITVIERVETGAHLDQSGILRLEDDFPTTVSLQSNFWALFHFVLLLLLFVLSTNLRKTGAL